MTAIYQTPPVLPSLGQEWKPTVTDSAAAARVQNSGGHDIMNVSICFHPEPSDARLIQPPFPSSFDHAMTHRARLHAPETRD